MAALGAAPRLLTAIALAVALAAAALPPAIYFALAYANLSAAAETRAEHLAAEMTRLVSANPATWQYQEHRFDEIVGRNPVHDELLTVRTQRGERIAQLGTPPERPTLTRAAPLHDSGVVVGRIEIERSMRAMLGWT